MTAWLSAQEADDRVVLVPFGKLPKESPALYSATAEVSAKIGLEKTTTTQNITFKIYEGKLKNLTLSLHGAGEVTSVTGEKLKDWSVRVAENGARFLDLRPNLAENEKLTELTIQLSTIFSEKKDIHELLLPGPGSATGFSLTVSAESDAGVDLRVLTADGLVPVDSGNDHKFFGTKAAVLSIQAIPSGTGSHGLELIDSSLLGKISPDGKSVSFQLTGNARAVKADAAAKLLGKGAALTGIISGSGWHVELREDQGYDLVAERSGDIPLILEFIVPIQETSDGSRLVFELPAGVVLPVRLLGISTDARFDQKSSVVPEKEGDKWRGFLPANGLAEMAWRIGGAADDGTLFFSSTETTDVRISSGLLKQETKIDLRILQGKIKELSFLLDGAGDVLEVSGEKVLSWAISTENEKRKLVVQLSRPIEESDQLIIESQAALGTFPVKSEALRCIPVGTLRHSGWLRLGNEGAVRVELTEAQGMIQLSPDQFPVEQQEEEKDEELQQIFVYRFPSAEYRYAIQARQVLPEISVTEVTIYELAETDRRISSSLELDIREAPLREWEIEIPADHAVASVSGAAVADYTVASDAKDGKRRLKVMFTEEVIDRQLITLKLEKNEAAKAGGWMISPLIFPQAKSRRGYIGAIAAAGYRLAVGKNTGLAEVPVSFFPEKKSGLQQAFRLRENTWQLDLTVEALPQSIQADVFHLYSLKSGAVYGSVLINYFVVGAPATEWKISVPEALGNIDITGQNVGRDWRREGNTLIIPLSRPVLGTSTVFLTFEQPMNARGGDLSPGAITPLDVQAERGYVQVVSPLQVKFDKPKSEGSLLSIDASELPTEFRLLSSAPTLAAWQYTARDFKIAMNIEWFNLGETAEQVVDFLKLSSRISRDGQWVTDARLFVKSRGRNAMRASLPKGAALWEAKVNGEPVNARADGREILIPLPTHEDPNHAAEVTLRYGARSEKAAWLRLGAPQLAAPVVIGEWTVTGDKGRQLIPRGGSVELTRPVLAENGWEWISRRNRMTGILLLLGCAAFVISWGKVSKIRTGLAVLLGIGFSVTAISIGISAIKNAPSHKKVLEYSAPVVAAGNEVAVEIGNVAPWQAGMGWGAGLIFLSAVALLARGFYLGSTVWKMLGIVCLAMGFLSIRGYVEIFFIGISMLAFFWWAPRVWELFLRLKRPKMVEAVTMLAIAFILFSNNLKAAEVPGIEPAESMVHDWQIRDGRLRGTVDVAVRGDAGDRFLLLRAPAALSSFEGNGLKVTKILLDKGEAYVIIIEKSGRATARATFEMPLSHPEKGWMMPGGIAAMRQVKVRWDQVGWDFISPSAVKTSGLENLTEAESGSILTLNGDADVQIYASAKQRDIATEETKFFTEVSNLFLPGPGVVNGRHHVAVRPTQGKVASLIVNVPEGFTVSEVVGNHIGNWRYDPENRQLRVPVEPAQSAAFEFMIDTQRGAAALPFDLKLAPLRVTNSSGEVGFLALAFGEDAQPEALEEKGLSRINLTDFPTSLMPKNSEDQPLATVQHAFRYGTEEASATLKVAEVAPELRAESWQLVSLGEDRLLVSTDLKVNITRSGIFRLELEIPNDLEIETATGEHLSHWTEGNVNGKRVMTLHLLGKTMGACDFNITLTGRSPAAQEKWQLPRFSLRSASRETGVLIIVPERGLQVRAAERKNISQLDPRELENAPIQSNQAATRPGALVYRLLQNDWSLTLAISKLDPWLTAQVFHDVTLREGLVLSRVSLLYKIENAAMKALRVRIPGLDANAAATVRAHGDAVADLVKIPDQLDVWEIRLQRGIAGDTKVDLEYQRVGKDEKESIETVLLDQARQTTYFTAVRAAGRLELEAGNFPRGWQRVDWAVVQSTLGQTAGSVAPHMAFRVSDPEAPLPVSLKRHQLADLQKLRVEKGKLTTLISKNHHALTAVNLKMQVIGKATLRLKLPKNAELFNLFVNDEGTPLVREGDEWLFYVFPSPDQGKPAEVRFVYSSATNSSNLLEGPILNVPMENLTWSVLVPEPYKLTGHRGDFDLKEQTILGKFTVEEYQSSANLKRTKDNQSAAALLNQASNWAAAGDQEKAAVALSNAVRSNKLDAASDEDARVQFRQLKTQQAVLGLNSRRQKIAIDNGRNIVGNTKEQLERASEANPILRGDYNYDPKQFDRFLEGNTADENTALKEIAQRIVNQQLAAEPAPLALDVTLPERGRMFTFTRSVQVDGNRPMTLSLDLKNSSQKTSWFAIPLCLIAAAMSVLGGRMQKS